LSLYRATSQRLKRTLKIDRNLLLGPRERLSAPSSRLEIEGREHLFCSSTGGESGAGGVRVDVKLEALRSRYKFETGTVDVSSHNRGRLLWALCEGATYVVEEPPKESLGKLVTSCERFMFIKVVNGEVMYISCVLQTTQKRKMENGVLEESGNNRSNSPSPIY
jgi:hypothetical protein